MAVVIREGSPPEVITDLTTLDGVVLLHLAMSGDKEARKILVERQGVRSVTAAGDSWRWQLRDKEGRWIEMGSEVKWLARGRWKFGIVIGSPSPGMATVEEALTTIRRDIPSAQLEVVREAAALIEQVEATRDEKGRIDWRKLDLRSRSPLPLEVTETPKISGPGQIAAGDLKPGDVFTRQRDKVLIRVLSMNDAESDDEYVTFDGIILSGPTAGSHTMQTMKRTLELPYVGSGEQDFDRDVLVPVKARLAALQTKYPDGMAAAIDAALTSPDVEPPPEMSPRLKELGSDVEVVRWMYEEGAARARLAEAEPYSPEFKAANQELIVLNPYNFGDKIKEYHKLLLKHQRNYSDWSVHNQKALSVITPHSDAAKEILAEVQDIGQQVRIGIEVDLAQRNAPSPELTRVRGELRRLDLERKEAVQRRLHLPKDDPDRPGAIVRLREVLSEIQDLQAQSYSMEKGSIDPEFLYQGLSQTDMRQKTEWKQRRDLTRRTVAELVGVATETKQTWASKEPKSHVRAGEVHRALTEEEQAAMTTGLLAYPASWVERFDQNIYTTSMSERGWHSDHERHITLSMMDGKLPSEDSSAHVWATIVHEEGHGMEQVMPGLSGLEAMFWHNRMGEDSKKILHSEDGAFFPDSNDPDKSPSLNIERPTALRYTLKAYGDVYSKSQKSWEVFTTGVQEVLGDGKTQYTRNSDAELWDFVMGALLTLDGRKG